MTWRRFWQRKRRDQDLARELESYLAHEADERSAAGVTADEARSAALRKLGNVTVIREEVYRRNSLGFIDVLQRDVSYGMRTLRRTPAFASIAVLALALGIGANTAIFTAVDAVLLRPLSFPEADRLVMVWEEATHQSFPRNTPAPANYLDWRRQNSVFTDMAALRFRNANLTGDGPPEMVIGRGATANLFSVMGVQPMLGRAYTPAEDDAGAKVVVLAWPLWQRRYGGDPGIVGRSIQMNGEPYTVVGVTPREFYFLDRQTMFFTPAALASQATLRGSHFLTVVARLKPGIAVASAQAEMQTIARRLEAQYPATNTKIGAVVVPLREQITGNVRPALLVLLVASGCVLLITCSNLANLMLARSTGRRRELAVRSALGAGQGRLIRQMLTESSILALLGGVAGVAVGHAGARVLGTLVPQGLPESSLGIDGRVLGFSFAVTVMTALLSGLLPALKSARVDLSEALKQGSRGGIGGRSRWVRNALVISEVALAVVLLIGAGLMIETLRNLRAADPGFRPDHLLTLRLTLAPAKYPDQPKRAAFYEAVLEGVRTLPGVRSAAFAGTLPFLSAGNTNFYAIVGRPDPGPDNIQDALYRPVTRDYFETIGARLLEGRSFTKEDHAGSPLVVVINEYFARQHWGQGSALGGRIRFGDASRPAYTIIGVVRDVRERGIELPMKPGVYLMFEQANAGGGAYLTVRTRTDPLASTKAVVDAVWAVDKDQPVSMVRTMDAIVDEQMQGRDLQMTLLAIFAGLALLLACLGIYGVLSYLVRQRVREIGLRMALGASSRQVARMFAGQGLTLTMTGLLLGLAISQLTGRAMRTMLFQVAPTDWRIHLVVTSLACAVALAACYLPARRAARVDPMIALREE